jgi:hypothetical protein
MDTKRCTQCGVHKEPADFPRNSKKGDGLYSWCKECCYSRNKEWRERTGYKQGPGSRASFMKQKEKRTALKLEIVAAHGGECTNCGYSKYLAALDFHHTGGEKEGHVSAMIARAANSSKYDRSVLYNELKCCIILCSNCHRGLHAKEWSLT